MAKIAEERNEAQHAGKRLRKVNMEDIPHEIEILRAAYIWILNGVEGG